MESETFVGYCLIFVLLLVFGYGLRSSLILFFDKVLKNLNMFIDDLWVSYSVREVSHLLTVSGLRGEEIVELREKFIKEVYYSLSRRHRMFLLLFFSRTGLVLYIGKAFDKKIVPLLVQQPQSQEGNK